MGKKFDFSDLKSLLSGGGGSLVGLSIGTSSVKLVELVKTGKTWKLAHFGVVNLGEDVIVNREIVNPIAVVDAIKTLVNQIKLKNKTVCASLSGTSMIIKRLQLEVPNPKELPEQIVWEAEQYIPFDVSDVVMDYQVLSRGKDNKTDVLMVAVKRSVLDTYMQCIEDAGLKPKIVDIDFFALANLFESSYPSNPNESVMIAEIGASATRMVVVQNGVPLFTKDASIGGLNYTAEIQKRLNLSFHDAEILKLDGGAGKAVPQEVSELGTVMAENIATEIKRSIDFYNASSLGAPVSYVLLSGGGARVPQLSRIVEESTGLPTQMINPFASISYDPAIFTQEYVAGIGPVAAVPVGLAMRAGAR